MQNKFGNAKNILIFALNKKQTTMFIICAICLLGGIGLGLLIQRVNSCKHDWNLTESGNLTRTYPDGDKLFTGWIKVYECSKCKKMRKEQIDIFNK